MKHMLILLTLCAAMVGVAQANPSDVRVNFGFFYSSLSPHGEWVELDAGYRVWRPFHVGLGWHPYLNGRWAWTDYGWYWVSYEPFGWAVFHYGRWYYDDFYGWVWEPGYEWGPAWVEWRYNDDYIGWAPLPPYATFSLTIGIHFTRTWVAPHHYWTFVGCRYFTAPRVLQYAVPVERSRRFFGSTRTASRYEVDNGRVINRGVDVGFVERRGNTIVERLNVVETRERGQERVVQHEGRERIEMYRPRREDVKESAQQGTETGRREQGSRTESWNGERKTFREQPGIHGERLEGREHINQNRQRRESEHREFQQGRGPSMPDRIGRKREEQRGRSESPTRERKPEEQRRGGRR